MPAIGILLPGSTLYPSIAIDFLQGVRCCLKLNGAGDIALHNMPVGYGINEAEVVAQTEKLLFTHDVDVVLAYVDHRLAQRLSPLVAAAGKLLVITNAGAHYPPTGTTYDNTLFHSLNHNLYSFMTGRLCGSVPAAKKAITATSYYDGGYQHCHAMTNAYTTAGGEIQYNFVSHYKKQEFNLNPLAAFIQNNPAANALLCLYSGDMARCFYEQIAPLQQQFDLQLYGSPMLFDNTPGDFKETNPYVREIKGYTGWLPSLDNEHNSRLTTFFQKEHNKAANLFSLQGWETALLINAFLQQQAEGDTVTGAIEYIKKEQVQSPRGQLRITDGYAVTGPAYQVTATGRLEVQVQKVVEDCTPAWNDMISQIPDTTFTTWNNTYLCI
ncbi:MAG: ABC transporter substrate-binding protein [Niastella sp.]|uniref:ABC transporter substrate-binding protein n=1 Tax=Niastella sp. TaxID=1869183 RepID=UPI0038998E33